MENKVYCCTHGLEPNHVSQDKCVDNVGAQKCYFWARLQLQLINY